MQREVLPSIPQPLWPGLSNYLAEAAELDDVLNATALPNITLVPAGPLPPSPAGLLESPRARRLVSDLLERADFVVFDCAPLSVGAEAALTASWTDGAILMVDLASSTDKGVREAMRRLEDVQAPLLGLVVNRDQMLDPSAYEYYHADSDRVQERDRAAVAAATDRDDRPDVV
jgi:Mrp family chromosome partitioning ATPase